MEMIPNDFTPNEMTFLVGMAQDVYASSDFDREVQMYLDRLYEQESHRS